MNPLLTKNFFSGGAINRFRLVVLGAADGQVVQASAATTTFKGVVDLPSDIAAAANDRVDVTTHGDADVEYGGVVTRGDALTSDASGRAIKAAPAAGSNMSIIGHAIVSGVLGDIGSVDISKGSLQG